MSGHKILVVSVAVLLRITSRLQAQHGGMHGGSWHGSHGGGGHPGVRGSSGPVFIGGGVGGGGYFYGFSPMFVMGPGGFCPRSRGWARLSYRLEPPSWLRPRRVFSRLMAGRPGIGRRPNRRTLLGPRS